MMMMMMITIIIIIIISFFPILYISSFTNHPIIRCMQSKIQKAS